MTKEFIHDTENNRYVLKIDGQIASAVEYSDNAGVRAFTRTFTPPTFRGQGLAAEIVKFSVDQVEEEGGLTISPACWYVEQWFDRNPERSALRSPQA